MSAVHRATSPKQPTTSWRRLFWLAMLCVLAIPARASAAVRYVNSAATGANDGSSWTNAFTSLPPALTAAVSGDEIWVAAGTYKPTSTMTRSFSFTLKNGVGLYGGFVGGETSRSQRDPKANVTRLSGDIGMPGNSSDNSYHVVSADSTVTPTAVLDGFTISGGNASGTSPDDLGGGLVVSSGSPTVAHCVFSGNSASSSGGAVRVDGGNAAFLDCTFIGNSAGVGGGVSAGSVTGLTLTRCVIRGNTASDGTRGGGIDATNNVAVTDCLVAQNSNNGVVFFQDGNVLTNTTVTGHGGYGVTAFSGTSTITNSILWSDATGETFLGISGSLNVSYSDVQGGFGGTGNISSDPRFVNPGGGDWRLGSGSPAVDAGNNAAVPAGITTDLAGLPRFFDDPAVPDTGLGTPPVVDMGAYERVPLSVSAPVPQSVCAGSPVSFSVTASGSAPVTYRWRRNGTNLTDGGSISGSATATLTINPTATGDSGSYDVVVTDSFSQTMTSSAATLTVKPVPSPPTASNNGPICAGQTLQLSVSTVSGATYSWTGPSAFTSSQQNPQILAAPVSASGTYGVTVTVNGCSSSPATTDAVVRALPSAAISAASPVCPFSTGNSASVPSAGAGAVYSWGISNGSITSGAGTPAIVYTAGSGGSVQLSVTVTDGNGCSASGSMGVPIVLSAACGRKYFTLMPCRVFDTRNPNGPLGGPALAAGATRTFVITGQCGIPADALFVSVNVTITQPTALGNLTFYATGTPIPLVSTINYRPGQTRANNAVIPLGTNGGFDVFCIQASGTVHFILDVNGYFQ
jgi:predicted outer membrane repeat protein